MTSINTIEYQTPKKTLTASRSVKTVKAKKASYLDPTLSKMNRLARMGLAESVPYNKATLKELANGSPSIATASTKTLKRPKSASPKKKVVKKSQDIVIPKEMLQAQAQMELDEAFAAEEAVDNA